MQRLEVSCAVRHIHMSLGAKGLNPEKRPGTHSTGGKVGPTGLQENLATTSIRSPDRPARSQSLYRLSYPGPHACIISRTCTLRYNDKYGKVNGS